MVYFCLRISYHHHDDLPPLLCYVDPDVLRFLEDHSIREEVWVLEECKYIVEDLHMDFLYLKYKAVKRASDGEANDIEE